MPQHEPRDVKQVMVSSTFIDLKDHRAALIKALNEHDLHPNVMENDGAKLVDVLESSLQMVRESAAYIGVLSLRYGQTLDDGLSLTEKEFNEAQALTRPTLIFIMGEDHLVKKSGIERDPAKQAN